MIHSNKQILKLFPVKSLYVPGFFCIFSCWRYPQGSLCGPRPMSPVVLLSWSVLSFLALVLLIPCHGLAPCSALRHRALSRLGKSGRWRCHESPEHRFSSGPTSYVHPQKDAILLLRCGGGVRSDPRGIWSNGVGEGI